MKRFVVIAVIVFAALLTAGIVIMIITLPNGIFSFRNKVAGSVEKKSYIADEEVSSVQIKCVDAQVSVVRSDDGQCRVEYSQTESMPVTIELDSDTLTIEQKDNRKWYEYMRIADFGDLGITVYLPGEVYDSLSVSSISGRITVGEGILFTEASVANTSGKTEFASDVQRNLSIANTSGKITVKSVKSAEIINISDTSGSITVDGVNALSEINLTCTSGSIKVSDTGCGDLTVKSVSGRVDLVNTVAERKLSVTAISGAVGLTDADAGEIVIYVTTGRVSGTIRSGKQFVATSESGKVSVPESTDGGRCEIKTISGAIDIRISGK